jgi:HK97 gp10 family phage protein
MTIDAEANTFKLFTKGFGEAYDLLDQLPLAVQRRVIRGATRAGAVQIAKIARAEAPVRSSGSVRGIGPGLTVRAPGFLRRQIKARIRKRRKRRDSVAYIVGRGKAFYASFVEEGLGGFGRGSARMGSRPNPFFGRAAARSRGPALAAFSKRFKIGFDREVARLTKEPTRDG